MDYIIVALLGMAGGAFCAFMLTEAKRKALHAQNRDQEARSLEILNSLQAVKGTEQRCDEEVQRLKAERAAFDARAVPYSELQDENVILKRDLRNIYVQARKAQLDTQLQRKSQEGIRQRVNDLGSRYLKESVKWIGTALNPNNYAASKQRLQDVIERCRGMGFEITRHSPDGFGWTLLHAADDECTDVGSVDQEFSGSGKHSEPPRHLKSAANTIRGADLPLWNSRQV
ncbi:MAG TPA: hypothetical protein VMR25_15790, partial [Planctomycetaceae bacterium]|nr:hypothetical protein [Planctomycetaceae bacterium]